MKLKDIFFLTGILLPVSVYSQYAEDALRFSQTEVGTTARLRALGGAQTALGGDNSSIAGNPAGLGLFTKSQLNFTPNFSNSQTEGTYLGNTSSIQTDKFGVNQFGLTIYNPVRRSKTSDSKKGWLSFNFGVGYNKTNSFNYSEDYEGKNTRSSFGDYLADYANTYDPGENEDLASYAYNNYLIDYDDATGYYPLTGIDGNQGDLINRSGSQSEFNIALGANYENKFYVGGSIGFASLRYNVDREFVESGLTLRESDIPLELQLRDDALPYLDKAYRTSYRSFQETRGSGVNLKLGFIYRANPNFRLGFNFISPTWYSVADNFSEGLNTRFTKSSGTNSFTNPLLDYNIDYTLRTPYRVNGGLAFTFSNIGLITGDVEFVDYSSIHYSSNVDRTATTNTNRDIKERYQGAVNIKLGAEAKITSAFALRAGYTSNGNPYINENMTSEIFTGGFGYSSGNLYIDLTYAQPTRRYVSRPYEISEEYRYFESTGAGDNVDIKNTSKSIYATIGIRF